MSYSLQKLPNDPKAFAPPRYALWVEDPKEWAYNPETRSYEVVRGVPCLGQVRHFDDLKKAKQRAGVRATGWNNGAGKFLLDWAIYEWIDGEYRLIFDGLAGEAKSNNKLFQTRLTKKFLEEAGCKPPIDYEVEHALASIAEASAR